MRKSIKKLFAIMLAAAMAVGLTACGGQGEPPAQSKPADQSQPADASSEAGKVAFTDALGQEFSIDPPRRAAVMVTFSSTMSPSLPVSVRSSH